MFLEYVDKLQLNLEIRVVNILVDTTMVTSHGANEGSGAGMLSDKLMVKDWFYHYE